MYSVVYELKIAADLKRKGQNIILLILINSIDMKGKASPGAGELATKVIALIAHKAIKVAISALLITSKEKVVLKLRLINGPTVSHTIGIFRIEDIGEEDKIPAILLPPVQMSRPRHRMSAHKMDGIHIIGLRDVAVHDIVGPIHGGEPVGENKQLIVDLLVGGVGLFRAYGLVHQVLLVGGHVVGPGAQVLGDQVVYAHPEGRVQVVVLLADLHQD